MRLNSQPSSNKPSTAMTMFTARYRVTKALDRSTVVDTRVQLREAFGAEVSSPTLERI